MDEEGNRLSSGAKDVPSLEQTDANKDRKQVIKPSSVLAPGPTPSLPSTEKKKWHYSIKEWVLDTKDEFYYYWLSIVSLAFAYNLIVIIGKHFLIFPVEIPPSFFAF